jgi:predicted PurR-regulated permease PerM
VLRTVLVVVTIAALYLLYVLRSLLITVFVAITLASALRPAVGVVQRRLRLSRPVAALALCGVVALVALVGTAALVPALISGTSLLIGQSTGMYERWHGLALALQEGAQARLGIMLPPPPPQAEVNAWLRANASALQQVLPELTLQVGGVLAEVAFGLLLAYYWLDARDGLLEVGQRLFPAVQRPVFLAIFDDIERVLGAYLGGQFILSALIGLACLLAFLAIGVPYAVPLAFANALLHMIPLAGATVGTALSTIVAAAISPLQGLATAVVLILIHQLENSLVAPRVLERKVGINPLLVLLALTSGAVLGGVAGALVAIPAAGIVSILARHLLVERRRADRWAASAGVDTKAR